MKGTNLTTKKHHISDIFQQQAEPGKERDDYLSTDESRESEGGEAAIVQPILINMSNVDLDRGVVLGRDDPVGGRAARTSKRLSYSHRCKTNTNSAESGCHAYHFLGT